MTVSILTITHGTIGQELISTAEKMLGKLPLPCETLSVPNNCDPDKLTQKAQQLCAKLDNGDGVLVLTDIFGSTPSNICHKLKNDSEFEVRVLAGLNLPMLIRALNYPKLDLDKLAKKALSGAQDGIIDCQVNE